MISWQVQLGIGVVLLIGGIFLLSGLLEILAAVSGVLLIATARRRKGEGEDQA